MSNRLFRLAFRKQLLAALAIAGLALSAPLAQSSHTTTVFKGVKVNGGMATHSKAGGRHVLTLSADFKVPDSPAPHWQVVDSAGNTYLLQRLEVKTDMEGKKKLNNPVTLPSYVKDVAKVQIWCAWAEVLLGEASFGEPQR